MRSNQTARLFRPVAWRGLKTHVFADAEQRSTILASASSNPAVTQPAIDLSSSQRISLRSRYCHAPSSDRNAYWIASRKRYGSTPNSAGAGRFVVERGERVPRVVAAGSVTSSTASTVRCPLCVACSALVVSSALGSGGASGSAIVSQHRRVLASWRRAFVWRCGLIGSFRQQCRDRPSTGAPERRRDIRCGPGIARTARGLGS